MQVKLIKSIANAPLMATCALAGAGVIAGMIAFLWPAIGWAWGPVTHLSFGLSLMDQLQLIAPEIAALLSAYPRDFLYGCLAADITFGKRFVAHESHHCHNWSVGFDVLKAAKNDHQRSFAYGYLCHLAADTIAHNLYVPYKIAVS
ncbi:MAG: zinc dependent phospholipase C family protein, partial [Deltaproteobacteria bacterium]|nr:zinc dependent phospholipase C family protein [Deltaproteobacteria bacterium]